MFTLPLPLKPTHTTTLSTFQCQRPFLWIWALPLILVCTRFINEAHGIFSITTKSARLPLHRKCTLLNSLHSYKMNFKWGCEFPEQTTVSGKWRKNKKWWSRKRRMRRREREEEEMVEWRKLTQWKEQEEKDDIIPSIIHIIAVNKIKDAEIFSSSCFIVKHQSKPVCDSCVMKSVCLCFSMMRLLSVSMSTCNLCD